MTDTADLLKRAEKSIGHACGARHAETAIANLVDAVRDLVEVAQRQQAEISVLNSAQQTSMGRKCK